MNSKGVTIQYGNVTAGAKENFVPVANESRFDTLHQLQRHGLSFVDYANPCELYQTSLDGTEVAFPAKIDNVNLGLWSIQSSNSEGIFESPIVLELQSEYQFSSQGLTLTFDTHNNIFATRLIIKWLRANGEEVELDEKEFYPDSSLYFCNNPVENYNKIIITFYSLNMPHNQLKLRVIDYGYGMFFYGDELQSVSITQQIDPISTQININTVNFILNSKTDVEYSFQSKQPLSVYFNGELKATTFIKKSTRKSKRLWNVQGEDYIGLLDGIPYYGGIYNNAKAVDVLNDIFNVAKIPYSIDDSFEEETITGYIPYTTCRDALMQIAFALQAVVDTSQSDVVNLLKLDDSVKQTIPLKRIKSEQNFANEEIIAGVEVAVHSYKPITETIDVYDANENGTGNEIFVKFDEPLHDLYITNGEIIQSGTNYAVINADEGCLLTGKKYEHSTQTRRKNASLSFTSDAKKVVSIKDATLVSKYNIDNVIEKCYNYITRTSDINSQIIEGKHIQYGDYIKYGDVKYGELKYGYKFPNIVVYDQPVSVGDVVRIKTQYLGDMEGRIIKQSFNLNGGIIIKNVTMR